MLDAQQVQDLASHEIDQVVDGSRAGRRSRAAAGQMMPPAASTRSMFSRSIRETGISRWTRISLRRSLRCTAAARVMQVSAMPAAIAPSVLELHGQMTMPSVQECAAGQPTAKVVEVVHEQPRSSPRPARSTAFTSRIPSSSFSSRWPSGEIARCTCRPASQQAARAAGGRKRLRWRR